MASSRRADERLRRAASDLATLAAPPTLTDVRNAYVHELLRRYGGDRKAVARRAGVTLKTVYNWINSTEYQAYSAAVEQREPSPPSCAEATGAGR